MSNEQIRKLLGGYATNTLTEAERKSLFEAALDDQELFNALHQEQALKDLLADPISRDQVRQALEKASDTRAPWWSRWWTWTGAAAAVASTVMIVAITRPSTKPAPAPALQLSKSDAAAQPLEKLDSGVKAEDAKVAEPAPPPPAKPARVRVPAGMRDGEAVARNSRKDLDSISQRLPAPPAANNQPPATTEQVEVTASAPAAPAQLQSRSSDTQSLAQQSQSTLSASLRDKEQDQLGAGTAAGVPLAVLKSGVAPISYTLLRRDSHGVDKPLAPGSQLSAGDSIRLTISPATSGYLFLYRREPSGEWTRVFPQPATGLLVSANTSYTVPDSPIIVTEASQNLRIALLPTQTVTGALSNEMRRSEKKAKASSLADAAANAPLFVDLVIGPKRVP